MTYANLDGWTPTKDGVDQHLDPATLVPIDRWALARLNSLVHDVTDAFEAYDVTTAGRAIEDFVDELSNWYVRRNRRRFWKSEHDRDKQAAYATLYTCLLTVAKLAAPFVPFVAEAIYRNLVGLEGHEGRTDAPESVHLAAWPQVNEALLEERLVADTEVLLKAVSVGRAARRAAGIKVRQPLRELWVRASTPAALEGLRRFEAELRDELNVKAVHYLDSAATLVEYRFKPNLRLVGRKYGKLVPAITAALRDLTGDAARAAAQAVEAGETITLTVEGRAIDLLPEEVLVESSSPEGYAVAEDGGVLVALDTALTPELTMEGLARELVRNIQDARKDAGFAISDRIIVFLGGADGDAEVEATLRAWGDYVREETLADDLRLCTPPDHVHTTVLELDEGRALTIGVSRGGSETRPHGHL